MTKGIALVSIIVLSVTSCSNDADKPPSSDDPNRETCSTASRQDEDSPVPIQPSILGEELIVIGQAVGTHRGSLSGWSEQRVKILRTLRGHDATGDYLAVSAKGASWEAGKQYLLTLEHRGIGELAYTRLICQAVPTDEAVASIKGSIGPPYLIYVLEEPGWGDGFLLEFRITETGAFEYHRTTGVDNEGASRTYKDLAGQVPDEVIADMREAFTRAGSGPDARDAGIVKFMWRNRRGVAQSRQYNLPGAPPASDLLKRIDELAVEHSVE